MSLLEVGHEMAQDLHEAGIINDDKMKEFDVLCVPEKYQPQHKPEVYLRFLNEFAFQFQFNRYSAHVLEIYKDNLWGIYDGKSTEECLDKAILETGFDKTLEKE